MFLSAIVDDIGVPNAEKGVQPSAEGAAQAEGAGAGKCDEKSAAKLHRQPNRRVKPGRDGQYTGIDDRTEPGFDAKQHAYGQNKEDDADHVKQQHGGMVTRCRHTEWGAIEDDQGEKDPGRQG